MTVTGAAPPSTFGARRRWMSRLRLALGVVLSLYILLLVNIIAFRHPFRVDLTEEGLYTLSRGTLDRLKEVGEEIRVVIPYVIHPHDPEQAAHYAVLERARLLLNEFMAAQPLIKVPIVVYALTEPERWMQVRSEYDLTAEQVNRILLFAGKGKDFRQAVTPMDLATFEPSRDPAIVPPGIRSFRGEKALSDAIGRLVERRRRPVYFTQDHGEPGVSASSGAGGGAGGMNAVRHELDTSGMDVRELRLSAAKEVPADARLLVIIAPSQPFASEELDAIDAYLRGGGRLLAALGPRRTGLEDLLARWGIQALEGNVQARVTTPGEVKGSLQVFVRRYHGEHPVTRVFKNVARFEAWLYAPRALSGKTAPEKGLEATSLFEAESREGETYFLVRPDETPKPGTYSLAMAVEQRIPANPPPGFQRIEGRIVATGGATFILDQNILQASHRDFLMNAVAWLMGEEERATVGGQEILDRTLKTDPSIRRFLFWVPIFVLPGIFLSLAGLVYAARRT